MSVTTITKENFKELCVNSKKTVLLDFWASWCGPCRMLSPVVDEIAAECTDCFVGKVNVDEEPDLANAFGIVSIPTLIVMKDGKMVDSSIGVQPKADIIAMLEEA
jgi:thioredoxin 1